jgi:phage terminase large subunit-like protein
MKWDVVYKRAYNPDGSLFFPERLSAEFLESAKKIQGSYIFANQYLNQIIPDDSKVFRKDWIRYYTEIPSKTHCFAFIDPAISEANTADFTAIVVIKVDDNKNWYVCSANRYKSNPTEIVNAIFRMYDEYKPQGIGVEDVAFQKALIYMVNQEMIRMYLICSHHQARVSAVFSLFLEFQSLPEVFFERKTVFGWKNISVFFNL